MALPKMPQRSYCFSAFRTRGSVVQGRLVLTPRWILVWVFYNLCSKVFLINFSLFLFEHMIIKFQTKIIILNFLLKVSDAKSDFIITLGYLNQALNNCALHSIKGLNNKKSKLLPLTIKITHNDKNYSCYNFALVLHEKCTHFNPIRRAEFFHILHY